MNKIYARDVDVQIPGVLAVHELHIWRLAGTKIIATVHVRFRNVQDYMAAADMMKTVFHDEHIHSTTIQPEFVEVRSAPVLRTTLATRCSDGRRRHARTDLLPAMSPRCRLRSHGGVLSGIGEKAGWGESAMKFDWTNVYLLIRYFSHRATSTR